MGLLLNFAYLFAAFFGMEAIAWITHKYLMHGLLWHLHQDHHQREDGQIIEKNDSFFIVFATPAILLFLWGIQYGWMDMRIWVALGITLYGFTYFVVHDIFIHQRFKIFRNSSNVYFKAIRRAHKTHHKSLGKEGGSCFGMLLFPYKFLREAKQAK